MSAMRLLLEGPDLPTLLEQIRTEYGAGARIIQAEKVRRGGVGGFFARERFNIQVEVPELMAPPKRSNVRGARPARSVMDLVDRLNKEEESLHLGMTDTPQGQSAGAAGSAGPAPLTAVPPAVAAPVSTQSPAFADVMSRLAQGIDSPVPAAEPSWGSLLLEPPEVFVPIVPKPVSEWPTPTRIPTPTSMPASAPIAQQPQELPPQPQSRSPLSTGAQIAERATSRGVPAYVLAGIEDPSSVYRRLLTWVESRPPAPMVVATPGQVVVVVGEVKAAMRVAATLAQELGVDQSAIHLAVPASSSGHNVPVGRLLSDVSDIAVHRQRWQHSVGSTIVVVEAALPPAARGWLAAVVAALAPTFTWAVAQASTKVDDVVHWTADIGEVDALALVNVPVTADPAASLAGPLPVGLLDGQRATVTRWMAMLTDEGDRR